MRDVICREEGYTLIETVVAMALFLTILIPLSVSIGNFMLDKKGDRLDLALLDAEEEMARSVSNHDFVSASHTNEHGFVVEKKVEEVDHVFEIRIAISSAEKPRDPLIELNKTLLTLE